MLFKQRHCPSVMGGEVDLRSFKPSVGIVVRLENVDGGDTSMNRGNKNNINSHKTPVVSGYWLLGIK